MRDLIISVLKNLNGVNPRDYQIKTIEQTIALLTEKNYDAVMVELPTGAGKTIVGIVCALILSKHYPELKIERIGWQALRTNLLSQVQRVAKDLGANIEIIPISTMCKNPPQVDLMIIDECHHDAAPSAGRIHKISQPKKVIGLSATPLRSDKAELLFQKSIATAGIYELVRTGFLATPELWTIANWGAKEVVDTYMENPEHWGKTVMYFRNGEECEEALSLLSARGVRAAFVHAGAPKEKTLDQFIRGELDVLINIHILTEGFDCPNLETVFVRPTNEGLTRQMCGRVLRLHEGTVKKIVQSTDSQFLFSRLAPVSKTLKKSKNQDWLNLSEKSSFIKSVVESGNIHVSRKELPENVTKAIASLRKSGKSPTRTRRVIR
jgi:superfamily II DNA or RNA helicase